mmetsp:Transcript_120712/g.348791  ORF Transcript_120712/g.348791 Transcript_120712/m.348791 type:complete len:211 (+) Transcript_120712:361-993(+)
MDAGLVVEEAAGHVPCDAAPIEPQVIDGKGDEHATHPEVQPTGLQQTPHASVHHGVAGPPLLKRLQPLLVGQAVQQRHVSEVVGLAMEQVLPSAASIPLLHPAPHLKALAIVDTPLEPQQKCTQRPLPIAAFRFQAPRLGVLPDSTDGEMPPSEVGRQSAASCPCRVRRRDAAGVALCPLAQEAAEQLQRPRLASLLPIRPILGARRRQA